MANPNLLATTACNFYSAYGTASAGASDFLATPPSDTVRKVVNLTFCNTSDVTDAVLNCYLVIGSFARDIATNLVVPTNSSVVVITKDAPLYLNDTHGSTGMRIWGNASTGGLNFYIAYEDYS